jgi:excisionase family DNA binding protein
MTTWLTVREAADYVRVSENLIRDAIKSGYLPAYAIGTGSQYRVRAEDIDEWMMSRAWEPKQMKYL